MLVKLVDKYIFTHCSTPLHCDSMSVQDIARKACKESQIYANAGLDGIILENMHDIPYVRSSAMGSEIVAAMTRVCASVSELLTGRCGPHQRPLLGVQVLAACNQEALAVAHACDFDFVRAEGFVFGHVADEGYIDGCAGPLLRYRKAIGADKVSIIADVKKKHSAHAITSDVSLVETGKAAHFFSADGVVVTGEATGHAADPQHIAALKSSLPTECPVLVGSGITADNCDQFMQADGWIVGSHFKRNGHWAEELQEDKVHNFMRSLSEVQSTHKK